MGAVKAYGEPRERQAGRPPWWALLAAVLVAALLALAIGLGIGRATAPVRTVIEQGKAPAAPSAAPAAVGPGPSHWVAGVPVGYAHSQDGAVQAARFYVETVLGNLVLHPEGWNGALDALAAPGARASLEASMRASKDFEDKQYGASTAEARGRALRTFAPLAYRVQDYSAGQSTVLVWAQLITAAEGRQGLSSVATIGPVTVVWAGGDWKLAPLVEGSDPRVREVDPQPLAPPASGNSVPPELTGFRPYA